jgi:O-antigen/teichoic acid export membrane protein
MTLVSMVVAARLLGTEEFGELGVIRNTTLVFTTIAGIGLGVTATKHVAQCRETDPDRAGRIIGQSAGFAFVIGASGATILAIFAPWIASTLFAAPHLDGLLRLGAAMLLFSALIAAQRGALSGFEAFRARSAVDLVMGLITLPAVVAGVVLWGLPGAVGGLVVSQTISWFVSSVVLHQVARRRVMNEIRLLWSFSLPATINSAMFTPVNWVATVILVHQVDGYREMGLFNAANQVFVGLSMFPQLLGQVVLPMLSNLRGLGDRARYTKLMRVAVAANLGVLVVAAVPLVLLAGPVMGVFGEDFVAGARTLVVLVLAAILMGAGQVLTHSIVANGRVWISVGINVLGAAALIALTWLLRSHGALGLAIATAVAYGIRFGLCAVWAPIITHRTWSETGG